MAFQPVTHAIFDVDGLLLDTEDLYTVATQNLTSQYSKQYTWEVKVKCMGMKGDVAAQIIIDDLGLPLTVEEYLSKINYEYEKVFPTAQLLPGIDHLVRHLHKHNIPIAIASGGSQASFNLKAANHGPFMALFSHRVMASTDPEVKNGKPAPDVFLICAQRFKDKPHPNKCLVFEDAPNGVSAACAAGMQVVMVPDSRLDMEFKKDATIVLESMEHFQPELFGLPPF